MTFFSAGILKFLGFNNDKFRPCKMNFSLTFVMLVLVAMANTAPQPKTFLVETADKVTRQGFFCNFLLLFILYACICEEQMHFIFCRVQ